MDEFNFEERAAELWSGTGLADHFPRQIEQAIALKLPVTVVKLPVVTVRTACRWLRQHHRRAAFPACRNELMGCLYADGGHGFIFVCGADAPEEQRFTLAHDAAHFLTDYWWPRRRVIDALGESLTDVLDGRRRARPDEKAAAVLAGLRLGPHWHLLPRPGDDANAGGRVACTEDRADDLGLELVAPIRRVQHLLQAMALEDVGNPPIVSDALGAYFGLPPYVFADMMATVRPPRPSFLESVLPMLRR